MGSLNIPLIQCISIVCISISLNSFASTCASGKCPEEIEKWISSIQREFPDTDLNQLEGDELKNIIYQLFTNKFFETHITSTWVSNFSFKDRKRLAKQIEKCDPLIIPGKGDEVLNSIIAGKHQDLEFNWFETSVNAIDLDVKRSAHIDLLKNLHQESLQELDHLRDLYSKKRETIHPLKLLPSEINTAITKMDSQIKLVRISQIPEENIRLQEIENYIETESIFYANGAWKRNKAKLLKDYALYQDEESVQALFNRIDITFNNMVQRWASLELNKVETLSKQIDLQDWKVTLEVIKELYTKAFDHNYLFVESHSKEGYSDIYPKQEIQHLVDVANETYDSLLQIVLAQEKQTMQNLLTKDPVVPLEELARRLSVYRHSDRHIPEIGDYYTKTLEALIANLHAIEEQSLNDMIKSEKPIVVLDHLIKRESLYNYIQKNYKKILHYPQIPSLINFFTSKSREVEEQIVKTSNSQLFELSQIYLNGSTEFNIKKDEIKGSQMLALCAKKGHHEAQYLIGKSFITSSSTANDLSTAAYWIYKSMTAGNKKAEVLWTKHQLKKYL